VKLMDKRVPSVDGEAQNNTKVTLGGQIFDGQRMEQPDFRVQPPPKAGGCDALLYGIGLL
jgi:hypothetical protein